MSKAELKLRSKLSEQTLFIVKPDGVQRKLVGEIISRFEKNRFTIIKLKMFTFTTNWQQIFIQFIKTNHFLVNY